MKDILHHEDLRFLNPERRMPQYSCSQADAALARLATQAIRGHDAHATDTSAIDRQFVQTGFPQAFDRLILILYAPGQKRILVSRSATETPLRFGAVFQRLLRHPRCSTLAALPFRLQMDFVVEPPMPVDLTVASMNQRGEQHFEIGLDGLILHGPDGKLKIFAPGDAYVRSIMGMRQLRDYLYQAYGKEYVKQSACYRFRSSSYLSAPDSWLRLYRGYPLVGQLTKTKVEHAVELAIKHIQNNQEENGKFLYYYDAARNSRLDHEHPGRDPLKNPFYNILRHGGGGLTCIFYEKYISQGATLDNIRRAIDYLVQQTRTKEYNGQTGAYIYSEKKAKLGGTGIALYLASEYQLLTQDSQYQSWADQLAWHLLHQITSSGEFIYYNIYLDREVTEKQNQEYFSFYYPGEAVCGMAKYLHLIAPEHRGLFFEKLRKALTFLLDVRPRTRAGEYTKVPSDSWLMMGIMELWDFPEMRDPRYARFVFSDAAAMIRQMYTVTNAPYPDYAGAFYYEYGDYPYADGARCEGLLGAYQLALKTGDQAKAREIWQAMHLAAWSLMHLVNTENAVYFTPNPDLALGGIRFKYTRQWFRIDTIQHVASFYAKMLPYWPGDRE
ncbi:hypothetical protein [Desulfonatronum parangueonense]